MGRKRMPGLYKRGDCWHIDKNIHGQRLCESTGTDSLAEAEQFLARRIEQMRQVSIYGVRPKRSFEEAAAKYVLEHQHKSSIEDDVRHLQQLLSTIGHLMLENVHQGTLRSFIDDKQQRGRKNKSINNALQVVRRILNLAATEWRDDNGLSWLAQAPKIRMLPITDARAPYPLSQEEQRQLFSHLPSHLRQMAEFKVNTGCRDQEVCQLRWEWEIPVPELNTGVFIVPSHIVENNKQRQLVKNGSDRLIVLNDAAKKVIDEVRGIHPVYVFTYKGNPLQKMNNSAWKRARRKAGLSVRVHDLKHTFGRRLRAAGVSFEDRQDLLGHKSGRITTHYSAAELQNLIEAANKIGDEKRQGIVVTLLRSTQSSVPLTSSRKNPANGNEETITQLS